MRGFLYPSWPGAEALRFPATIAAVPHAALAEMPIGMGMKHIYSITAIVMLAASFCVLLAGVHAGPRTHAEQASFSAGK